MSVFRRSHLSGAPRRRLVPQLAAAVALVAGSALVLTAGQTATAQVSPNAVQLGTAAGYSVLAGTTVTNTGDSVLGRSVGLDPGTAIVGFPPGIVQPPATIQAANADTLQAQADLTTAYNDAAGRATTATVSADLGGQTLVGGVYTGDTLGITGTLTLNGQDDPNSVFVFQAASTLITATGSRVELINGANPCNVFWQVGSSATLSGPVFVGTILALTSISVNDGVAVNGRALARNGAVTLINDTFTSLPCDTAGPATTTSTTTVSATTTPATTPASTTPGSVTTFTPTDITLPSTGTGSLVTQSGVGFAVLLVGFAALLVARRRQPA